MSMTDETEIIEQKPGNSHRWVLPVIALVAVLIAIAGVTFGFVKSSDSSRAHAQAVQANSQINTLAHEISQLQTQDSRIQSQLSVAESQAQAAQSAAHNANLARLGVCWSANYQTNNGVTWVQSISVDQAISTNGVYTCPQGDTFVSVVPQASNGSSGG